MADERDGGWIRELWDKADTSLAMERRDYQLNYAFIEGDQWVYWHKNSRQVAEFPRDKDSDRVRRTANRMTPNLVTLLAKLTKRTLGFEVPASAADDGTRMGARLGEHILEAARIDCGWEAVRLDEMTNAFLGGTSAVIVEWDPRAGDELGVEEESGNPVNEGQVQLSALSIGEFTMEPGSRTQDDARWVMTARAYPPEQVMDLFQLDEKPESDAMATSTPLQRRLWSDRGFGANVQLSTVYTYYEKPNSKTPKGRHVVVVGQRVVVDRPWPFKSKRLNCYAFRQTFLPRRWTGATLLNDARKSQVAYNYGLSILSEHMKLAGNARLAIPDSSGVDAEDLSDLPGELLFYDGMSSQPPRWLDPPQIPRWLVETVVRDRDELDNVMTVHDISRGQAPGDRNSGLALSVLAEKDETPLGLMAHDQATGWGYIASFVLELWSDKVIEQRTATVNVDVSATQSVPVSQRWTGKDLAGQTRVVVSLESTLPHSRVAIQAWIMNLADRFPDMMPKDPSKLARLLDLPGADLFGEMVDADVAQATMENHLLSIGEIPAAGDKPYPLPWDDHAKHIAEHNRFRKSQRYVNATQYVRDITDLHVKAHEMLVLEEAQQQAQMNAVVPGIAALPQAHEPLGSMVPPDAAERQSQQQSALPQGAPSLAGG